ncbi:hypothetical protein C8J57DRAFT_1341141, partial [Mycena rebaudengoi]
VLSNPLLVLLSRLGSCTFHHETYWSHRNKGFVFSRSVSTLCPRFMVACSFRSIRRIGITHIKNFTNRILSLLLQQRS